MKLLDRESGRELASLASPDPQMVERLVLSRSGSHFAVVGSDGSIHLWNLDLVREQLRAIGLDW